MVITSRIPTGGASESRPRTREDDRSTGPLTRRRGPIGPGAEASADERATGRRVGRGRFIRYPNSVAPERRRRTKPASAPAPPVTAAPAAIGRTAAWLAKQVELALVSADLSLPQYRILGLLTEGSAVSSALAERLAVRPPSITAVVDGLVSRGLVERRHAEDDRRRVAHVLTAKGEKLLATANEAVDSRLAGIAGSLETDELTARALEGLELWRHAMAAYHNAGSHDTTPRATAPEVKTIQ